MFKSFFAALLCLSLFGASAGAAAQEAAAPKKMSAAEFVATLNFQNGKINLPGGIATLDLPPAFRYLPPADAERLLVDGWGNPPGIKSLGMIVPADVSPMSDSGWAVVVTYDKDGHVKDDDADSIEYGKLLKEMQESTEKDNAERAKQGYPSMSLVGWAEAPSYDKANHKLYWAKELSTANVGPHSLNYNIRVLGREGVLVLNAVAGMEQIGTIKTQMQLVNGFTEFTPGQRYADFNSGTDKVAEYGIAALVAGGVAAKLGLFGKLFAVLLAFKKLIFIGVAAFGAGIAKLFGRKKAEE
ncbi:MAG: DUF2167 domain-containing protein [Pseudomonadota bacterium]